MSKKVAEAIVDVLESAGVKQCYGVVGDTLNTFAWRMWTNRMPLRERLLEGAYEC